MCKPPETAGAPPPLFATQISRYNFYTNIDAVYKDLLDKRITIGVANQERQMRIQYAKSRFAQILKSETGE